MAITPLAGVIRCSATCRELLPLLNNGSNREITEVSQSEKGGKLPKTPRILVRDPREHLGRVLR